MGLEETGCEGVDWSHMIQWREHVDTVMKLRFPQKVGNFLTS